MEKELRPRLTPDEKTRLEAYHKQGVQLIAKTDVPQAAADLLAITRRLEREYPKDNAGHYATVESLDDALVGEVRPAILVLMGAATFVLLIACANVANLALSRALSRRREFGVRVALGASAGRILRQSLTESLFIALLGGACGYVVARLVTSALLALYPGALPQTFTVHVDATALVFATFVSLLTGVFFGLAPALASSRNDVQPSLRDGARGSTHGREGIRLRRSLVVVQVALAIVLLVGSGLLARTLANLQSVELGFEPAQVAMVDVPLSGARYESRDAIISFWDALLERMRADRALDAAALGSAVPLWGGSGASLAIENRVVAGPLPEVRYYAVSDGYFETLGIGTAYGRLFTSTDRATSPMVAVVNEAAARTFWPNEPVIGARIRLGPDPKDPWREIIGVVRDARFDRIDGPSRPAAFVLHRQDAWNEMLVAIRSRLGAREVRDRVRVAVRDLDPAIAVNEAQTMEGVLGGELARRRFAMALLGAFAAIALVLAVVGIYGVVAYSVTTRMQELGVRVALGARAEQIIGLVMGQGVGMAVIGLVFGTVGAAALSRLLRGLLYGVAPLDLATFTAAPALLLVATALACWVPARRASRVDPVEALRAE